MSTNNQPLAEALGHQYIHEFFRGALFLRGDTLYQIRACYGDGIQCYALQKEAAKARTANWSSVTLPMDALKSFTDIKWPKLGYRNLDHGQLGNQVSFISSTRSVQRGLKYEHLTFEWLPVNETMGGGRLGRSLDAILRIFFPVWFPFKEGMKKLHAKELAAFAINEDVAVGLSVDQGENRFADIYYRGKVVGQIREDGDIIIANKTIKRGNLKHLYALLED